MMGMDARTGQALSGDAHLAQSIADILATPKQLDDTQFFFGMLHTMQEMGGHRAGTGLATAYQNWAAGRTTQQSAEELVQLGLIKPGSVKYGKTGHVTKLLLGQA
jgi:hypothetical protein